VRRPLPEQLRELMSHAQAYLKEPGREPEQRWFGSLEVVAGPSLIGDEASWVFRDSFGQLFGVVFGIDHTWRDLGIYVAELLEFYACTSPGESGIRWLKFAAQEESDYRVRHALVIVALEGELDSQDRQR
jgi:hypothetical protein